MGDDAKGALRTHKEAGEIVPRRIRGVAAQMHDISGGQHHFQAQHVIGGHAVFKGVGTARIFRHIAPDRTRRLARWVRRIVKTGLGHRHGDVQIDHAGLDHRLLIDVVNLKNFVHAVHFNDQTLVEGERAATEARARATCDKGDVIVVGQFHQRHHLLRVGGEGHGYRGRLVQGVPVALIHQHLFRRREHRHGRHDVCQVLQQFGFVHRLAPSWAVRGTASTRNRVPCTCPVPVRPVRGREGVEKQAL